MKKKEVEIISEETTGTPFSPTQKEKLEELLQALKDNDVRSIGDLEVKISRL